MRENSDTKKSVNEHFPSTTGQAPLKEVEFSAKIIKINVFKNTSFSFSLGCSIGNYHKQK